MLILRLLAADKRDKRSTDCHLLNQNDLEYGRPIGPLLALISKKLLRLGVLVPAFWRIDYGKLIQDLLFRLGEVPAKTV